MAYIYRRKLLFYLITGLILVSFVQFGPLEEVTACRPSTRNFPGQQFICPSEAPAPEYKIPDDAGGVIVLRMLAEKDAGRQTGHEKYQYCRFPVAVSAAFFVPDVIFRTVLKRFGNHMIELWQKIGYIHRADGKKENAFLYGMKEKTLHRTGGVLHAEKQNRRQGQNSADR